MIHQIDSKNEWLLLSVNFTAKVELVFVLTLENAFSLSFHNKAKRKSIASCKNGTRDFQDVLSNLRITDLRCRKAELDLTFLKYCFENSLTPKFLHFKVSNRSLKLSDPYRQCQIRLLKEDISNKKSIIRQRQLELVLLKNCLKASMNVIDYAHICSIFLISNDKILTKQEDIQDRKIIGLIKGKGKSIDPENVIFNFSSYVLSDNDKSLLSKCLNFSLPNKKLEILE